MKIILSKSTKFFTIIAVLFAASCTSNMGNFSVISTQNVRGLEYGGKNRNEITSVSEKSCSHRIYLFRTALGLVTLGFAWFMPAFDIILGEKEDDRLESAVNNAINSGKSKGVFDGDVLVNSTIKEKNIILPLIYGYKCVIAEGDVASSVTRTQGFLEKKKEN